MVERLAMEPHTLNVPGWVFSPLPGHVRWTTLATGVLVCLVVAIRTRQPIMAVAATMTWLCGFEILYQATGAITHRWSLGTLTLTLSGTGGWLVLSYYFGFRPRWSLLAVFAAVWLLWLLAGFESNMPDRLIPGAAALWNPGDEALNVVAKTVLAAVIAFGSFAEMRGIRLRAGRPEYSSPAVAGS